MIDALLKFSSEAAAAAALASERVAGRWRDEYVIPDVKVWRSSQDVAGAPDLYGNPTVVHTYLPGYFMWVSLPAARPALMALSQVQLVLDRDKANVRQAGALLKSTVGAAVLADIRFEPVYAGADVPFGAFQ